MPFVVPFPLMVMIEVGVLALISTFPFIVKATWRIQPEREVALSLDTQSGEYTPFLDTRRRRRSILKLGASLGVLAAFAANVASGPKAEAYVCDCGCDISGRIGGSCYEAIYDCVCAIGQLFFVCDYYCCPPGLMNYCDSSAIFAGYVDS